MEAVRLAPEWEEFAGELSRRAEGLSIPLEAGGARLLALHASEMLLWNRKVNLTRITAPRAVLVKHVLDTLIPALALPETGLALDVGSGAGYPGIPLRVLRPGLRMALLEADRRKASFLRVVAARLGLSGLEAIEGRIEGFSRLSHPLAGAAFDLVVMRAVSLDAPGLLSAVAAVLRAGGLFAFWGGARAGAPALPPGAPLRLSREVPYELPEGGGSRKLLVFSRNE